MAATGISERVGVGPAVHGHATPTSFWALTLGSIGVVYGDIGTSPLYALKESLAAATAHAGHVALTHEMVVGVVSLKLVTPAFDPYVVPLSLAILIGLFAVQSHGTARVASFFGPITAFWFAVMGFGDLMHILDDPGIIGAINPLHGLSFLIHHGTAGLFALGAVFLSVTGAEALYADLGHFGRSPIRTAWLGFVLPALALNYLGQGAMLLAHPEHLENPFFLLYPSWALLPMVILATMATIIASQAVITGAFSISQQAMQLGVLPRFRVLRTSETEKGQIYIPYINWLLLAAVILLVVFFKTSSALAAAYGIAVTGDMVITTCLLFVVAWKFWRWSPAVAALVIAPFLAIELIFLGANALKIPQGGWFPLMTGAGLFTLMWVWRKGSRLLAEISHQGRPPLPEFIRMAENSSAPRVPGTAMFLTGNAQDVPAALLHNMKHNKVLHEKNIILTVITEEVPRLRDEGRVTVERLSNCFLRVTVRFGFMESPSVPKALREAGFDVDNVSFFLSRRALQASAQSGLPLWQDYLFIPMARSASDVSDQFCIPEDQAVEVGTRITI